MNKFESFANAIAAANIPGMTHEKLDNLRRGPTIDFLADPTKPNVVVVRSSDGLGGFNEERYSAPVAGGYVRDSNGKQVCDGLLSRGSTLCWSGKGQLVNLIRREAERA
jgi:hypothetical protein